jgi:replication factor C small subunit
MDIESSYKLPVLASVQNKLDYFYYSKKIPHILFHGPSGTGKRTIVHQFLTKIYGNDKAKMKSNIMSVNCAHGKGIKFIRDELKFFAKSNIQFNCGVIFKTIVLLNADFLTIDAQSALRRCIELFSFNTRFFIIVENKHKLLNPILSRFCEIYIPETVDKISNKIINTGRSYYQLQIKLSPQSF